jgi:hypothetical protein
MEEVKQAGELLTDMAAWNIRLEKEWERLIEKQAELDRLIVEASKPPRPNLVSLYTGTLAKRGSSSFALNVPKIYLKARDIDEHTPVACYMSPEGLLFKFGKKTPEAQP